MLSSSVRISPARIWAPDASKRAEHAAIPGRWLQDGKTPSAFIEIKAGVYGNDLQLFALAKRAGNYG